jgi:tetratricopeptide (TPR) repeat protein
MYLARETRAVTVKEITAQCFISSENTTSNALKQLTQKGFLISKKKGREAYYEISEVLMRLCLEMKNAKNGDLKLCVDFIRIWFRPNERQEYLDRLEADGKLEHAKYFRLALADAKSDPILLAYQQDLRQSLDGGEIEAALIVWRELVCVNKIGEVSDRLIIDLIASGKSTEAITAIEDLLSGGNSEELYLKGLLLYESEQWEKAKEAFDLVIKLNPEHDEAWFQLGNALSKLGRDEEAIASYDRSIQIKPDSDIVWVARGYSLGNLDRYDEEISNYNQAIKIEPNNYKAWHLNGIVLCLLSKYQESLNSFNRATKIKPDYKDSWYGFGLVLNELGRYEEAIASYDRCLEIEPNDHVYLLNRANALRGLERYEEAITNYDRCLEFNPNDDDAWFGRGYALDELGRYEEAVASYDRCLEIEPNDHTWFNRGVTLRKLGRYEEVIANYYHYLQIKPDNDAAWNDRGYLLHELERYEEAITSYDRCLQIKPDNDAAWNDRGIVLRKLGKYEEAIASYDRSLELKSDDKTLVNRKIALDYLVRDCHTKGVADFKQENYPDALTLWQQTFNNIQQEQLTNSSDLIQEFLDDQLLPKFQQPAVRDILPQLLTIYTTAQVLPELAVALTRNLKAIQSPTISDYTANQWLKMWQELGKSHPELALALRMLEAGIKYKQNPTDDRVFLSLPQEMRPLLREALGLEP